MAQSKRIVLVGCMLTLIAGLALATQRIPLTGFENDKSGVLHVYIDGRQAIAYQYGDTWDLTHFYPLNSPSGRNMLVEKTNPYPHHRSFWFADKVQLGDHRVTEFYNALYSGEQNDKKEYVPPFKNRIRHIKFDKMSEEGQTPLKLEETLLWEMDGNTPVLDEHRKVCITPMGDGQYFMDIIFTVTASYGDVKFVSDAVHYAWPYVRINKDFNGDGGGVITNDSGQTTQKQTNNAVAKWVDYSKKFDDGAEGLTIFSHPSNGHPHRWLTREYGTFGPRRIDAKSGKPFTLGKGQSISQRVGIYVHRGDVQSGKVAQVYQRWVDNKL